MTEEGKHQGKLPRFNDGKVDEYHLRSVRGKTILRRRELLPRLKTENMDDIKDN